MKNPAPTQPVEELEARAAAYQLYSLAFREPSPGRVEERQWGEVYTALPGGEGLPRPPALPEDLDGELRRVFGHNLSPDCPPYETHYGQGGVFRKTQELSDIAGFYRAFGVEAAQRDRRPDHLPVELEFVSLLCVKQARAVSHGKADRARLCREARARFLRDHLGRWLGPFAAAIETKVPGGYYALLARSLASLALWDAGSLGVDPWAPTPRPARLSPEGPGDPACDSCFGGDDERA
jgi:TorA maturation chaperone TorD